MRRNLKALLAILLFSAIAPAAHSQATADAADKSEAAPPSKFKEAAVHGFVALREESGETIGGGDLTQELHADLVTSHLTLHFKDGSSHEETSVFSQSQTIRLVTDHLVQKGPSFKRPMDMLVDCRSGHTTVRTADDDGKQQVINERLPCPPALANGITSVILRNAAPSSGQLTLSLIVANPKPRIVKLEITPAGEDTVAVGGISRKANHYVIKIQLGGVAGVVAPIVGKQPPDTDVWIIPYAPPQLIRSKGQLADGSPIWILDMTAPSWPQ